MLLLLLCVLCVFVVNSPAQEPLRTPADRPIDIQHIRLDLKVDLPKKTVDASAQLKFRCQRPVASFALDAVGFEVQRVTLRNGDKDAGPVRFRHDGHKLTIDLEGPWQVGQAGTLRVDYRVREPKAGLYFFGPTPAEPEVPLTVWSQGETEANRHWFPCLDHPSQRQSTELVVTVADGFEALSNGKLVERQTNPDGTATFHWRQEQTHPSYLVTLVVGRFDVVREEWNQRPVLYYVPKGRKDDVARTFGRTREMLELFSKRFGVEYPWEKYAQVVVEQFMHGGMENTSATTLTDWALHDERAILDSSAEGLVAHELAHQWWGDMLTCKDWAHTWLNEGFASYSEALWEEHARGPDAYAYDMLQKAGGAIDGGKGRPVVDRRYPNAWSMFDGRAYPKGAWLLHMLRRQLGEDAFWKGLRRYAAEHRFQSVETSDFRKTLERETGRSLERFFYDWTERPGSPVLEVNTDYLADSKLARLVVRQTQQGEAFHFPLAIHFRCPPRSQSVKFEQEIAEKEQTIYFPLPDRPTLVEVDPEQLVLAEIKENKGRDWWLADLREAANVSTRVRAAQHFGRSKEAPDRDALAKALAAEKFWGVQVKITTALAESGGDFSRDTLLQGLQHAEPRVRRACAEGLGRFHRDAAVAAALKAIIQKGDASYFVEAEAVKSYAKIHPGDTAAVLLPALAKPSHTEVIRRASLEGLGNSQDLATLDTLLAWTKRGKPRNCRTEALKSLIRLARSSNPTEDQLKQMVAAASACLEGEGPAVRTTAVETLRDLGRSAAPTVAALEALSVHDPADNVRDLALKAIAQIRGNATVPVELSQLREELDRLKRTQDGLRERLDKFEKLERR